MSFARALLITVLALGLNFGALATPAAAEDGDDHPVSVLPPEALLIREVIAEFRLGLLALREACGASGNGEDLGALTREDRRALLDECQRGMKELRDLFHEAREAVLELKYALHEQDQLAREEERRAKEEERAAEERAREEERLANERVREEEERRRAEEKAREEERRATEKTQHELAKKRGSYEKQARDLEALVKYKAAEEARLRLEAQALRERAETLVGAEREKLLEKAAVAEARAGDYAQYVATYVAQRNEILAALARLGSGPSNVVFVDKRVTEVASKAGKYRDQLAHLDEKIAYKEGERDRYADYARELRAYAEGLFGDERERYLQKADDADRQADEWERAAAGYRAQRAEVQAALEQLLAITGRA